MDNNNLRLGSDSVSGVDTVRKSKGKVIAGVAVGVVAVAGIGGAVAYATSDYVKNQVKLAVSSPQNYYAWVTEKNSDDFAKQISDKYREAIEEAKKGQTVHAKLSYEFSDYVKSLVDDDISGDLYDVIKDVNSFSIGADIRAKDKIVNADVSSYIDDSLVTTIELAAESSGVDIFMRAAELSERWLAVETEGFNDDDTEAARKFAENPESIISPDELETEILKYTNLWSECVSEIELEKKADVQISDITVIILSFLLR